MMKIRVAGYREHGETMQIVSGRVAREKVHYEAPLSSRVPDDVSGNRIFPTRAPGWMSSTRK